MSTTAADHFAQMVPGESFFSLTFPSQEDGAAQPPCESQQTSCMDSDDTATNKEDDEEDESTEMGASLSPSSVHIVNPESPDDDAYAGQQCIESSTPMDHQEAPAALSGIGDDGSPSKGRPLLPNGKKTKGRVKIKMEFIDNKLRRYTTFSKRKTGIMKKAYELSTLTGTQVMLLVASETGHVYTFATKKLQPMITSEAGKALIQTCLNSTDGTTPSRAPELGMTESSLSGAEATLFTSSPASSKCNGRGGNGSGSTTHPRRTKLGGLSRTPGKVNYHRSLPQGGFKNNSKSFSLASSFANDLPTMVTPVPLFTTTSSLSELAAAFQSSDEGEPEVDESRECSPSVSSQSIRNGLSPASGLMTSGRMQQSGGSAQGWNLGTPPQATNSQLPQRSSAATAASSTKTPVFSFTGMLPNGSLTTSGQQQPFGFIPAGIAPNGAFMYQMPSGLVYAAPTAALPMTADISGQPQFMFAGFPTTASATAGVQDSSCGSASSLTTSNTQQQYITIPVPIPITPQSLLHPGLMQTFQTGSPVKEEQEEQQQQQEQKGKE